MIDGCKNIVIVGPDLDYLSEQAPDIPRPFQLPRLKSAVVAPVRNEGIGLLEWIAHYRVLRFDSIFIYANDNSDGSDLLLERLALLGVIKLRRNVVKSKISPVRKARRHALWLCPDVAEHDWVAFLDADEFLIPCINGRMAPSIGTFVDWVGHTTQCSAICLNWKWFPGDRAFTRSEDVIFTRFRRSRPDNHVKTIFKIRDVVDIASAHHVLLRDGCFGVDGGGNRLAILDARQPPAYDLGQVNHYWQKSFEEFHVKKERVRNFLMTQRDYGSFFKWWSPGEPDRYPDHAFIDRLRSEIEVLRALDGISAAESKVRDRFRDLVGDRTALRQTYDALSNEYRR